MIRNYNAGKEIICNTDVLESKTCDRNHASVLLKCNITVIAVPTTLVVLKNYVPLVKFI